MKATFDREIFAKVFAIVASVVNTRSPKEILQNVRLEIADGKAVLTGTDMDIWIRTEVEGIKDDFKPGVVLLRSSLVSQIIKESTCETITFEDTDRSLVVKTATGKFDLPTADPNEFPTASEFKDGVVAYRVEGHHLSEAIRKTVFACDPDSTRYALGGIAFICNEPDKLTLVGTDGRRLGAVEIKAAKIEGEYQPQPTIVPQRYSSVIQRVIPADFQADLTMSLNQIRVTSGHTTVICRLVEGRFPNWRQVIPTHEPDISFSIAAGRFDSLIRQAAITVDAESRGLEFEMTSGDLRVSGTSAGVGKSNVSMPIALELEKGEKFTTKLDYRFMRDFLAVCDPTIDIRFSQKKDAAALMCIDGHQYVVMPMALER